MRPRFLALVCCILLASCSDGPAAGPTGQSATEKTNAETGPLVSRNPGAETGGIALLLEGPNAMSRLSAQGFADIWAANLDRSGFPSYEIVQLPPRRIEVRLWGLRDSRSARNALRSAYGNPIDIRVIQERALPRAARFIRGNRR
ncbi:MAG: hypothetical protein QOD42_3482 [Sphingomonadales bacterium]|jgi:hypothetical protein|nr:hypothetical protein [Sphingomonadales bacterium]